MATTKISFDTKKNFIVVENNNVLEDEHKKYKSILNIQPFVLYVEVPVENGSIKPMKLELAAKAAVTSALRDVKKQVTDLVEEIQKFQKNERAGDAKASTKAEKCVKSAEGKLKDAGGDIQAAIRKEVERVVASEEGKKRRLRSTGRTHFRGMKLAADAFQTAPDVDLDGPADTLEEAGEQLAADSNKEAELRGELVKAMEELSEKLKKDKAKLGSPKDEWAKVLDQFDSDISALEKDADKYETFLSKMKKNVAAAMDGYKKLYKKVQSSDSLKRENTLKGLLKDFKSALDTIEDHLPGKESAAKKLQSLRKTLEKFDKGQEWDKQTNALKALKSTMKSGKAAEEAADKLGKWVDKN